MKVLVTSSSVYSSLRENTKCMDTVSSYRCTGPKHRIAVQFKALLAGLMML